jgi:SAM-dependent methyltransferase
MGFSGRALCAPAGRRLSPDPALFSLCALQGRIGRKILAGMPPTFDAPIAEVYEGWMVPLLFAPYAQDLVRRAPAASRVLEIAAGTGVVTRELAAALPPEARIVATDLHRAMLDRAQAVGTSRPVDWQVADAMALPFEDAGFDLMVCQSVSVGNGLASSAPQESVRSTRARPMPITSRGAPCRQSVEDPAHALLRPSYDPARARGRTAPTERARRDWSPWLRPSDSCGGPCRPLEAGARVASRTKSPPARVGVFQPLGVSLLGVSAPATRGPRSRSTSPPCCRRPSR